MKKSRSRGIFSFLLQKLSQNDSLHYLRVFFLQKILGKPFICCVLLAAKLKPRPLLLIALISRRQNDFQTSPRPSDWEIFRKLAQSFQTKTPV